nr:MAG TPA_asm: hypothetical protein [Bacteriophage sp.]
MLKADEKTGTPFFCSLKDQASCPWTGGLQVIQLVGKCQLSANLTATIGKGWFSIVFPLVA